MPATVSFVIVNYNGEKLLPDCLRSVYAQTHPPNEVIVVDNASIDGSRNVLEQNASRIQSVPLAENVGFGEACNRGVKQSSGELIAVLNNDVALAPDWLKCLISAAKPPWDFWASQIRFQRIPERIDSAGDGMAVVGAGYKIGHGDLAEQHNQRREVFGPCAAAALYSRRLLEAVGGFDEDFFLIYEDADLNLRARLLGYRCLYVPEAQVLHRLNASIVSFSQTYVYFGHRNSEYVFWKNMPLGLLLLYLPERICFNLLSLSYFSFKGHFRTFVRAKLDVLRNAGILLGKRRRIQATRKVHGRQLRKLLDRNWLRYRRKRLFSP